MNGFNISIPGMYTYQVYPQSMQQFQFGLPFPTQAQFQLRAFLSGFSLQYAG